VDESDLFDTIAGGTESYTDTNVSTAGDSTYFYRVAAVDSSGNVATLSNVASATPITTPLAWNSFSIDEIEGPSGGGAADPTYFILTVDADSVSGTADLYDFPMLITADNFPDDFKDSDNAYALGSGAGGVRFTDAAGDTLPYEVVSFEPNSNPASATAEIWVLVDTLSYNTDTEIKVSCNAGDLGHPAADATYGSEAVWADYEFVQHLDGLNGSTANAFSGTSTAARDTSAGKIGGAYAFYGDDTNQIAYSGVDFSSNYGTASVWFLSPSQISTYNQFVMDIRGTPFLNLYLGDDTGFITIRPNNVLYTGSDDLRDSSWHYVSFSYDASGNVGQAIVDGITVHDGADGLFGLDAGVPLILGNESGSTGVGAVFNGIIDEARLASVQLSIDFMKTQYKNMNSASAFATGGSAQ